ncbi:MAG: hypothetical protein J2P37_28320 [Ktedonobacteraceae bacterium]|nr:hypothetical protein [Ktedonobacteraceae bacterium]MBO0790880.1 hypothetical protein [Ktedonobacteraceae bacterium]
MIGFKGVWSHQKTCRYRLCRSAATIVLVIMAVALLTGCQLAQNSFSRTVKSAGAAFSAATLTLDYAHSGKITEAYARSTFMGYQSELQDLDQQLTSQDDVPNPRAVQELVMQYKAAMAAINQPCLAASCDWHSQRNTLLQASRTFLQAGGA